ncbi:MAG: CocE/NonD family hydrolase [Parabacteroides sp.]
MKKLLLISACSLFCLTNGYSQKMLQQKEQSDNISSTQIEKALGGDSVMVIYTNVMTPMRDGVKLASNIYRLKGADRQSVLVNRTPYGKDARRGNQEIEHFVKSGYTVVVQDVRGRYNSEGEYYPFVNETDDGVDLFTWIASQPWCDGNIGTFGSSYHGATQWLPARKSPEAVKTMIAEVTFSDMYEGTAYQGGAKVLHDLSGAVNNIIPSDMKRRGNNEQTASLTEVLNTLPMTSHPLLQGCKGFYIDRLNHPTPSIYWEQMSANAGYDGVKVPVMNISGWYDIFLWGTIQNYMNMRKHGGSELARNNQRLILGPWHHGHKSGVFPDVDFGEKASENYINLSDIKRRWYDHWVRGIENGIEDEAPVMYFTMGSNEWHTAKEWPLPETQYRPMYLSDNRTLSWTEPVETSSDSYTYDPMNPVPTVGGQVLGVASPGPYDQSEIEKREDVLVYTSPVLDKAVEVTGMVELKLYISSSALDTDFTGKLVDVYPDGRAIILTEGILRARYRNGMTTPQLMDPGKIYELDVNLWATSNVFLPGHRIRLEVSSSNFPRFNRNSNSGGNIANEPKEEYRPAVNTVYHSPQYTSRLILPIIER